MLLLIIAAVLLLPISCKPLQVISVEGNVNQSTSITIPFSHVISATVTSQHRGILAFAPNRFRLQRLKQSGSLPSTSKTLLEELRTPFSNQFTHIFGVQDRFIIFKAPRQFLVLRQAASKFEIERSFSIPEMTKGAKFHLLHKRILLIIISSKQIIFMTHQSYSLVPNVFNATSVVFSKVPNPKPSDNTFVVAGKNCLYVITTGNYTLTKEGRIDILPGYDIKSIWIEVQEKSIMFWMLDVRIGVVWAKILAKEKKIDGSPMEVLKKSYCYDMDIKFEDKVKLLLTCAQGAQSWFIKALYVYEKLKPILVKEWRPHIEPCRTSKFIFYKQHVFSLQKQSLDVFLPSIYAGEKDLFYIKNWISLAGHSAYWIDEEALNETFLIYSISNSSFIQWELLLQDYTLYVKSPQQIRESFNLTVQYVCSDSASKIKEICEYETTIEVDVHSKHLSFVRAKSWYFGIILLLATSVISIWYICCIKYRQIERRALEDLKTITNPISYKL